MQPAVHATTRTPGPSTVEPVVKECRNPMSPLASAARTSASERFLLRPTRSSKGSFASIEGSGTDVFSSMMGSAVESPVDDVHLLLACQAHEVHSVPRHANRQAGILLRVI